MFDPETNAPHTAHTTYDVPLIVVGEKFRVPGRQAAAALDFWTRRSGLVQARAMSASPAGERARAAGHSVTSSPAG
jgi:hypothetical protein